VREGRGEGEVRVKGEGEVSLRFVFGCGG
jgi:hypothetical protein